MRNNRHTPFQFREVTIPCVLCSHNRCCNCSDNGKKVHSSTHRIVVGLGPPPLSILLGPVWRRNALPLVPVSQSIAKPENVQSCLTGRLRLSTLVQVGLRGYAYRVRFVNCVRGFSRFVTVGGAVAGHRYRGGFSQGHRIPHGRKIGQGARKDKTDKKTATKVMLIKRSEREES